MTMAIGSVTGSVYGSRPMMQGGQKPQGPDADGDGSVTRSEMDSFVNEMSEKTGKTIDVDDLFAQCDTDGDGVLNADEDQAAREYFKEKMGPPPDGMRPPEMSMSDAVSAYQAAEADTTSLASLLFGDSADTYKSLSLSA
jgi:hypothetical protein